MDAPPVHDQLAADTHALGVLDLSRVLLHREAAVPWYILVPRVEAVEWLDLGDTQQYRLQAEIRQLGRFIRGEHRPDRVNIATIGNRVPQLHVHVVARYREDPCWPGVVWGRLATERRYPATRLQELRQRLSEAIGLTPREAW